MPEINYLAIFVAALVPNILGAIYYGQLFSKPWLASLDFTEEDLKGRNDALNYGSAFILSLLVSGFIKLIVESIHKDVGASGDLVYASFHTFMHGALHGMGLAIGLVIPVLICLGIFQKTKASNVIINAIYWLLCFAIMGGILDMWS